MTAVTPIAVLESTDWEDTYTAWCPRPDLVKEWVDSDGLKPSTELVRVVLDAANVFRNGHGYTPYTASEIVEELLSFIGTVAGPTLLADAKVIAMNQVLPPLDSIDFPTEISYKYSARF